MALRGYFDGSGANEPQHRAITLAGLSASEKVWPNFENAWGDALQALGLRHWHTKDLRWYMTDQGFSKSVHSLLAVIADFREAPMVSYRSTVILEDYRRASAENPEMKRLMRPEALCIDGCIGNLVFPTQEDIPAIIYFDRDEPFKPLIEDVWRQRQKMFDRDWSRQIEDILPTSWDRRGIQAADLLAWLGNRYEVVTRRDDPGSAEYQMLMSLSLPSQPQIQQRITGSGAARPTSSVD